jgi:hypothetical protein
MRIGALVLVAVALVCTNARAADFGGVLPWLREGRVTVAAGAHFISGDYDRDHDTTMWYVPFELRYDRADWTARVTVPYIRIDGPMSIVAAGGDGVIVGDAAEQLGNREGLGDVLAGLSYTLRAVDHPGLPVARFTAKAKFGTADPDERLGTGENDYTLQLDLSRPLGPFLAAGMVGYRFMGSPPGAHLRDTWLASSGLGYRVGRRVLTGVLYSFRQSSVRSSGDLHALMPYASVRVGRRVSIMPYALVGLSRYSPDFGAGLRFGVSLPR